MLEDEDKIVENDRGANLWVKFDLRNPEWINARVNMIGLQI